MPRETGAAAAFRTTDPDVIAAFQAAREARSEWGREMIEWIRVNLGDEFVLGTYTGFGAEFIAGIQRRDRNHTPGPGKGWRHTRDVWVPDQRSKVGKELAKRFDPNKNRPPSVRALTPGMPDHCFDVGSPGLLLHDGVLWATWAHDLDDERWASEGLDFAVWERARLSEFHAAAEASEEAA